ncbi:MAG: ATP-binding protein [Sandaracinaceae bacterium]
MKILEQLGRIRVRLLIVNLVVVIVPVAGLEFARIYEQQLLSSLQRDMRNQAALVRETVEAGLRAGRPMADPTTADILIGAARNTRTRIRVLDEAGQPMVDSHAEGPPEGPELPSPTILPGSAYESAADVRASSWSSPSQARWPDVHDRREVQSALAGHPDAYTRIRERGPSVFLFVTDPVRIDGDVAGVIYVTRSTTPVLEELYKIRTGLIEVLVQAMALTLLLTLILAWSISRPLSRLAKAARRITRGDRGVEVPVGGSGEIRDLGEAFRTMTTRLDGRMQYISEFAADVGHELKSPLTSIRGAAELLREGAADDPVARARFLENIELDAERLDRLVNRLLELSRIDSSVAPMEEFDLGAMVGRVVDRTHTAESPVVVDWQTETRRWRGREEDLERALLNLVENALRFSPDGAAVDLTVRLSGDGSKLRVSIADHGEGVPEAHRSKIFERFFTTDADRNGTGLGLAIVASVAAAHRGEVELAETDGGGATFHLTLGRG